LERQRDEPVARNDVPLRACVPQGDHAVT